MNMKLLSLFAALFMMTAVGAVAQETTTVEEETEQAADQVEQAVTEPLDETEEAMEESGRRDR